jgi:tRNA A37 threonylcarbamoyladenosine modification protein TsaB
VYAAGYRISPQFEQLFAPFAAPLKEVLAGLEPESWTFTGVLTDSLREQVLESGARLLSVDQGRPQASSLLRLAWTSPEAGRIANPARWEPTYVRASSAERRLGDV